MNVFLIDVIKEIVTATSNKLITQLQAVDPLITKIYFEYGHYTDIQERLQTYSSIQKNSYPLICLFEDHAIDHGKEGLEGIANIKMIILYPSRYETREERELNVFRPILYPIYFELLRQFKISGYFNIYDETKIKHRQINRPHWGDPGLYKNEGYLFGAMLDGIELSNLQLETFLPTC